MMEQKIFLFGSRAKGTAREHSDWDLLVLFDPVPSLLEFFEKGLELEFWCALKRVQEALGKRAILHPFIAVRTKQGYTLVGPNRDEPLEPWLVPDRIPRVWGTVEEMLRDLGAKNWEEVGDEVGC